MDKTSVTDECKIVFKSFACTMDVCTIKYTLLYIHVYPLFFSMDLTMGDPALVY